MKKNYGFTLVELLATIIILAILLLLAIPSVLASINSSKKKTFVEYVNKIYQTTRNKISSDELDDEFIEECKIFNIKTDLGLASTGSYDGYVLVKNNKDDYMYYLTMHDNDYSLASYFYNGILKVEDLIDYDSSMELTTDLICSLAGCSCGGDNNSTTCESFRKVSDRNPGEFSGKGTSSDPYKIESAEDLVALAINTNNGSLGSDKYYILTTNLLLDCDKSYVDPNTTKFGDVNGDGTTSGLLEELTTGKGFLPIGSSSNPFRSHLDGNDKTITKLYLNDHGDDNGLFGNVDTNGSFVKNLTIEDASITNSYSNTGILAGSVSKGTITNVKVSGDLKCAANCGGVVGSYSSSARSSNTLENVTNSASIQAYGYNVGGIVGNLNGGNANNITNNGNVLIIPSPNFLTLIDTYVGGANQLVNDLVTKTGSGGIVGTSSNSNINNAKNFGKLESTFKACNLGGIVGFMQSGDSNYVSNSENRGEIVSSSNSTGGIIGRSIFANVYNVYNYKNITFNKESSSLINLSELPVVGSILGSLEDSTGGVIGYNSVNSNVINAGNNGNISSTGKDYIGGVVGRSDGIIYNVYNTGNITIDNQVTGNVIVGGIAGYGSVVNAYTTGNITIENYYTSKSLLGSIFGGASDQFKVGLAVGKSLSSNYNKNVYAVGNIKNNFTGSISYSTNYGGLFGNLSGSTSAQNQNFYAKVRIEGLPKVSMLAGNNFQGKVDNIYIDMYTDASDVKDTRISSYKDKCTYTNFLGNLNNSPYKKRFTCANNYTFNVNSNWFRDTLNLGNNFKYEDGYYPQLYKVSPSLTPTSELLEGQKKKSI